MTLDRSRRLCAIAIVCLLAYTSLPSLAGANGTASASSVILITLQDGSSAADVAASHGGRVVASFPAARAYAIETRDAAGLARDARVVTAEPNGIVHADASQWDTASWSTASWNTATWDTASWNTASWNGASWDSASWDTASWDTASWDTASWDGAVSEGDLLAWGLVAIGAPAAWAHGVPETTRTVCLVDSGIDASHPRLADRLWRGAQGEFGVDLVRADSTPEDENGHGTHLAGIIAGAAADDPFRGVAAPLVASAKVLDANGVGRSSDVIAGIAWCDTIRANIILLALSEDAPTKVLARAIRTAQQHGALVVASAGNAGPCEDCVHYPAAYPRVLAVGAAEPDGTLAPFSSTGHRLDLAAPGVGIASAFPGSSYRVGSGSSQASAFAAGAAALLWAQDPDLRADEIARLLTRTAHVGPDGTALLDLAAAAATLYESRKL